MIAAALFAASTALTMYSSYKQSSLEAKANFYKADLEEKEIDEMSFRFEEGQKAVDNQKEQMIGQQQVAMAAQGGSTVGASFLNMQKQTMQSAYAELSRRRRVFDYETAMKRRNAEIFRKTGKDIRKAGWLNMFAQGTKAGYELSQVSPGGTSSTEPSASIRRSPGGSIPGELTARET